MRPWKLGLGGLLWCLVTLGVSTPGWSALQPQEFDDLYYSYSLNPQPQQLTAALDCFVHLTGTASVGFTSEKEYRLFIASRARFFAILAAHNPALLHHAKSLFPQSYWIQKNLLLEIFKRSKDAGLTASLNHWAQIEEDDDRRLMLEQTALTGNAPEAILNKPLINPMVLDEQWALFFATGDTTVVIASLKNLRSVVHTTANSLNAQSEISNQNVNGFKERIWGKLERYSSLYPAVRLTLQT